MQDRVTVSVLIGNSDNKLAQAGWSAFIAAVAYKVEHYATKVFFSGFSAPDRPWQNACWVFEREGPDLTEFKFDLAEIAKKFDQESIAIVVGTTEMVKP